MRLLKRPKRDSYDGSSTGIISYFFSSKVALMLIAINGYVFWLLKYNSNTDVQRWLDILVLYPEVLSRGHWWVFVTSGFVHLTWSHLLWNMLGVFIFTRIVERDLGIRSTLFVYFGALIVSMLFSTVGYVFFMHKSVGIIGASGAVMGMLSAAMLLRPFAITYGMIIPMPVMINGWLFICADIKGLINAESDGVSHLAHMCGFFSIAILVYFLSDKDKKKMVGGLLINALSLAGYFWGRQWYLSQINL